MINVLSYIGMSLQSEVCLWTLLGLIRTIFDATLFKVNANLKQVWQMTMPEQLSIPVQRTLRTMISGVMLVQCFTVYIYLASYIVLLYPVFLEERPTLVLPWLLLAAIRKLLCELTSLALGLGTCVLVGPTRPPCIKFLIIKLISIMPAFYTWMLLFSYYHTLKLAAAFKTFPAVLPANDQDYGLELAIRRRRTKSLLGEEQLRSKLVANLYSEPPTLRDIVASRSKVGISSRLIHSTDTSAIDVDAESLRPLSTVSKQLSDTGSHEDWFGSEVVVPRDTDRILEQFVQVMLRIKGYLDKEGNQEINSHIFNNETNNTMSRCDNLPCTAISLDESDTPPQVGSIRGNTASYLREYPQIFMKKSADVTLADNNGCGTFTDYGNSKIDKETNGFRTLKHTVSTSKERVLPEVEEESTQIKNTPQEIDEYDPSASSHVSDYMKQRLECDDISIYSDSSKDTTRTQQILTRDANVLSLDSEAKSSDQDHDSSNSCTKLSDDTTKKVKTD